VKVFISTPVVAKNSESRVSFIGSILEETPVFSLRPSGGAVSDVAIQRLRDLAAGAGAAEMQASPVASERLILPADFDILKEIDAKYSSDAAVNIKEVPEKPFDKIMVSYKTYPSEISGPARFREVIYKPELPAYLRWDEGLGVNLDKMGNTFSIELKFRLSPEGKVEGVERLSSSGHPTVDLVGIRYLMGWQFAPLKAGGSKEEQWGSVKLNFSLTKADAK